MKITWPFFLTQEEKVKPLPLLTDTVATVAALYKVSDVYNLRIVDINWKAVLPLGTLVVPLPLRIPLGDELGLPISPKWCWYIALSTEENAFAIVDLRPDQVPYSV